MNIENRIALVTGANRGIGKSLVQALLAQGVAKVYAGSRQLEALPDFNDDRVIPLLLDITNTDHVKNAANVAKDVDLLINNAGVAAFTGLIDGDLDLIERDMQVNYFGTLSMCRQFIPLLEKHEKSSIVNVVTIGAFANFPVIGGYCASKSAVFSLSQGLRIELAPKNISVHTVNPGPIDTDMAKDFPTDKTSPNVAANNILESLKQDEADIFPDPMAQGMFAAWQGNYRDLEKMVYEMHHQS